VDSAKDQAIEAILNGMAQRRRDTREGRGSRTSPTPVSQCSQPAAPLPAAGRKQHRCHCGICKICVDNARWEKVFNEKFSDPDYYTDRPVRQGSSLSPLK
jgi:hypothetical protein